jgi:hypothetical protein
MMSAAGPAGEVFGARPLDLERLFLGAVIVFPVNDFWFGYGYLYDNRQPVL